MRAEVPTWVVIVALVIVLVVIATVYIVLSSPRATEVEMQKPPPGIPVMGPQKAPQQPTSPQPPTR